MQPTQNISSECTNTFLNTIINYSLDGFYLKS